MEIWLPQIGGRFVEMMPWLATPFPRSLFGIIATILIGKFILYVISTRIIAHIPVTDKGRIHAIKDVIHILGNAILFCIVLFLVLNVTFSIFGIDIVTTLVSAGIITLVVSIIVGLAMQAITKDIIAWLLNKLYEDRYREDEHVKFNMVLEGTITAMHMRFLHIRDEEGNVYTVPYSWISVVMNRSRPQ